MNKTRSQANMIGGHIVFNNPLAGGAEAAWALLVAIIAHQKIMPILSKMMLIFAKIGFISWRAGGQLPAQNFAQHFFLCPKTQPKRNCWPSELYAHQFLSTKFDHVTPLKMVSCFVYGTIQKSLVQANGCIQYYVAMQCAFSVCFS